MKRVEGAPGVALIECVNPVKGRWHVRWDVLMKEDGTASYMEKAFIGKPAIEEIKSIILDWYNSEIRSLILNGFVWNDTPVWLSLENQNNFKAVHDLALHTSGANLPVTFKVGENLDGDPCYYTFENVETLTNFYTEMIKHIQNELSRGWKMKDAFNPEDYQVD